MSDEILCEFLGIVLVEYNDRRPDTYTEYLKKQFNYITLYCWVIITMYRKSNVYLQQT